MKKCLALSCLFLSLLACVQHSPQEVKKLRITKITKSSSSKASNTIQKNETWYDDFGNDTAEYNNGELFCRTTYEYNTEGRPLTRTKYGGDGKELETASYTYKPDGSYTASNTDKSFGMTELTYCDKTGKTIKTVSPDGSERIYMHDAKGRLVRIKSNPGENGGVVVDIQCTYNSKGQMIKEVSKGDYKWTCVYTYNAKGMIAKVKRNSVTDGVADPEVTTTYEYEFRK